MDEREGWAAVVAKATKSCSQEGGLVALDDLLGLDELERGEA